MLMSVPFLQKRGNVWRYRSKVPSELKEALGRREIVFPIGASENEALRC
jgi:hypothetical protein